MKRYIFMCLVLTFLSCKVQKNVTINPDLLNYEKIIELEKPRDQLYILSNSWMVETFNSAESVIEFSDKENGIILGKYVFLIGQSKIKSIIQIDTRDKKCRISFKNPLVLNIGKDFEYRAPKTNDAAKLIRSKWENLSLDFEQFLIKNDSWN